MVQIRKSYIRHHSYPPMRITLSHALLTYITVGAVTSPTGDALTLSLLAVPMCLLYEICIWLAYFNQKKELAAEAQEEAEIQDYVDRQHQKESSSVPVPVAVPGRISTEDENEDEDYHEDYHDHEEHDDDYHHEGEEMDDGEIEDFSKTIETDTDTDSEPDKEDSDDDDNDFYDDDDIDYNPGASFEAPPAEVDENKENKDDKK